MARVISRNCFCVFKTDLEGIFGLLTVISSIPKRVSMWFIEKRKYDFKLEKCVSKNENLIHTILLEHVGVVGYYLINSAIRHERTP